MGVKFTNENAPQDKFVNANGMRFHYLEWGNPDNPPMLLLHGFAQTCHSWDFVALGFSDNYRVIVLDQRGHGDSDWASDGDYSPETQQEDISGVVNELGLDNFVLMGLSMGGRNSFTYAANNSGKVKALVVVDAAPQNMQQGTQNIRSFVQQDDELDSVDAFVERVLQYNRAATHSRFAAAFSTTSRNCPTASGHGSTTAPSAAPAVAWAAMPRPKSASGAISSRCNARHCLFAAARATSLPWTPPTGCTRPFPTAA